MPKLTREDWTKLRDEYHVAFRSWSSKAFKDLLDAAYGAEGESKGNPGSYSANPGTESVDNTDALMVSHVYAEPPIQPAEEEPVA
jgi:hypothetical protein